MQTNCDKNEKWPNLQRGKEGKSNGAKKDWI
jgi:hypothetical protein